MNLFFERYTREANAFRHSFTEEHLNAAAQISEESGTSEQKSEHNKPRTTIAHQGGAAAGY
jgi:hypothetical protein